MGGTRLGPAGKGKHLGTKIIGDTKYNRRKAKQQAKKKIDEGIDYKVNEDLAEQDKEKSECYTCNYRSDNLIELRYCKIFKKDICIECHLEISNLNPDGIKKVKEYYKNNFILGKDLGDVSEGEIKKEIKIKCKDCESKRTFNTLPYNSLGAKLL